jgi:hypothetical protein
MLSNCAHLVWHVVHVHEWHVVHVLSYSQDPNVFYYCRTYYKAVRVGGGGEWRTCAMRDDELNARFVGNGVPTDVIGLPKQSLFDIRDIIKRQ